VCCAFSCALHPEGDGIFTKDAILSKSKNSAFLGQKIGKCVCNQPRTINFSIKMDKKTIDEGRQLPLPAIY
jgi:hypothetical protein